MKSSNSTAGSSRHSAMVSAPDSRGVSPEGWLESARNWAWRAKQSVPDSLQAWIHCAIDAYRALDTDDRTLADEAAAMATRGAEELLSRLLGQYPGGWLPGPLNVGDVHLQVEFRELSSYLQPPLRIRRAQDVSMAALGGERFGRPGFGVPLVAMSPRSEAAPMSQLLPPIGVFRNLTAWLEPDPQDLEAPPHLVLADPQKMEPISIGGHWFRLANDTSAGHAWAIQTSNLRRLGLWGLISGTEMESRAGLYLLEDYDKNKRPLVMIHGLGSSPLIWARLSNAVWGAEDLRKRFQIWHVVYQTDAPVLVARLRVQRYLEDAWHALDPEGDAPARSGAVLVGHSLGGVVARLLCVESGDALWDAAFLVPPEALEAKSDDLEVANRIFRFHSCPGVARAVFLAAPHRGSPSAATLPGRLTSALVGRRTSEIHALRRVARSNPDAIRPELRGVLQRGWINSITTLQAEQPVRRAAESLLPPRGIPYHTIAGIQPGRRQPTDGYVPLDSAQIPGADSSLVLEGGHSLHEHPLAIAEVLRILRE
jgi:pimeloyl-ACP methyl ester carboxylesterase